MADGGEWPGVEKEQYLESAAMGGFLAVLWNLRGACSCFLCNNKVTNMLRPSVWPNKLVGKNTHHATCHPTYIYVSGSTEGPLGGFTRLPLQP